MYQLILFSYMYVLPNQTYVHMYVHVNYSPCKHVIHTYMYIHTCTCISTFLAFALYNQETFAELQVPFQVVNAARRIPVVEYTLKKALSPLTSDRHGLLTKCTPVDLEMAKKLLDHGYKQLSKFKRWCPVEVSKNSNQYSAEHVCTYVHVPTATYLGMLYVCMCTTRHIILQLSQDPHAVLPPQRKGQQACPVVYGTRIYFPSSQEARSKFIANPEYYLHCQQAGPAVPVRLAIVGPPKSGKSTGTDMHSMKLVYMYINKHDVY